MNKQEIERLVASLTDDEIELLRDVLAEQEDDPDPRTEATGQFLKSLLGGGHD